MSGLSLSPQMRELLGVLGDDWKDVSMLAHANQTARALKNRGLVQLREAPALGGAGVYYEARLTAAGSAYRERLIARS